MMDVHCFTGERANYVNTPHIIAMVGLPARGKTYIAKKLLVFNLGEYRRQATTAYKNHDFFRMDNMEAMAIRIDVLKMPWKMSVFDAKTRLKSVASSLRLDRQKDGIQLFFVNLSEVKVHSPDYQGMNNDDALTDFLQRISHYQDQYEAMDDHGETDHNISGRIGGDSDLSGRGRHYAKALAHYIKEQDIPNLRVWTSWLKRTIQTASGIDAPQERWKALNEIDAGTCEEMTYEEIAATYPEEFAARDQSKFSYRYPRGESYEDLVARLEPVIMELERQENVLVIGHQAVLRCLLAYFLDKPSDELPYLQVPLHTVIKLTPVAYGCRVEYVKIPIEAVDTHRPKPPVPGYLDEKFRFANSQDGSRNNSAQSLEEVDEDDPTIMNLNGNGDARTDELAMEKTSFHKTTSLQGGCSSK
ncbi:6-phosphofructo-2-kinase/fructose-2,6-bisphosphatase [Orchesella cincta]|uniref:6-phosphofructo-2-kinase/fructose-2, 6-bisphosphatase n=1 Tax=Orchesella cincta TaxID=48709 RepID=A0A1D2NCA4_ORCCI|nr:6-phosphofructo-2-kinase/fructose-2,6-bisphosphatase [Orchesella cincta]